MKHQNIRAILITGRTIKQGKAIVRGKLDESYAEDVAYVELSPEDIEKIGAKSGEQVVISSSEGKVELKCKQGKLSSGIAFMPYGPWANTLIGTNTGGTGMPDSKGFEVTITQRGFEVI